VLSYLSITVKNEKSCFSGYQREKNQTLSKSKKKEKNIAIIAIFKIFFFDLAIVPVSRRQLLQNILQ
jgi:hypothetical protein